jgi:hypothetical protein
MDKFEQFQIFQNNYCDTIIGLLDFCYNKNLLPFKIILTYSYLKDYIKNNKVEILEGGISYLLLFKNEIMNFDITNLENDFDDNLTSNESLDTVSNFKSNFKKLNEIENNEIVNLIIDIKNNSKKLDQLDTKIIKNYFEILFLIIDKIKTLF